jgi:hypothetical protein
MKPKIFKAWKRNYIILIQRGSKLISTFLFVWWFSFSVKIIKPKA